VSTTPIADTAAAELSGLVALGFSDSQAKTIIVARTMEAANLSKQIVPPAGPKLVALIDDDGDRHDLTPAGDFHSPEYGTHSREWLEQFWGPVKEVFA